MGWYVHLHVAFPCSKNEPVAAIARKHLPTIDEDNREARWFLSALAERTGHNKGPKGGLSLWGIIGNYTHGDTFAESLRQFWYELLTAGDDTGYYAGPLSHERIIVFEEQEQSGHAKAHEIFLDQGSVKIVTHDLPFTWGM